MNFSGNRCIDSEVFSYKLYIFRQSKLSCSVIRMSEYMFSETYKYNDDDKSKYESNFKREKQLLFVKDNISKIENDFIIKEEDQKRLLGAISRIVPIKTDILCDLKDKFLKNIGEINKVVDESFGMLIEHLKILMTDAFSEDQEKIIKNGIKNDLKSGRDCVPLFLYREGSGMFYNGTWFKNFSLNNNKFKLGIA